MKRHLGRGALALSLAVAPFVAAAGQARDTVPVVTLNEARRRAAAIDPVGVAARAQTGAAAWERRAATLDWLTPTVTAGAAYTRFSQPFFNFGTLEMSSNATSATLQASYTLLGAGKLFGLSRAGASVASAEANETAARFRVALLTDADYFAVVADRELARMAAERLRRATEQFGVARARVLAGEAIAPDSLQLLLEVTRARLGVLRRDSALAVSRLRLGKRVGLPGPVDAAPGDTAMLPALPFTQDAAVNELHAGGPELLAARAAERRAGALVGAEWEGYFPDITLGYTTGAYDSRFFPSAAKRGQFQLTVAVPIWNAGQRELAVARARAERDVARARREEQERGAAEAIAGAYHGYQTARAGIELAATGVMVSRETFRVQSARYREGASTILDLLEAQVALSEAEAQLAQARFGARVALAQIEALLGRRIFDTADEQSGR